MRFVDAQLPPALARMLVGHGHVAEHVTDIEMSDACASFIWDYAPKHEAVIISKDEDFPYRLRQSQTKYPFIIWLRIGNCSRRALLTRFEPLLPRIETFINRGDSLIEVR